MKYLHFLIVILCLVFFFACKKDSNNSPDDTIQNEYHLVWNDEFNYSGLPNESKWNYDIGGHGWGNKEEQYYTASRLENSEVKDGYLYIRALKEDYEGKKYTSARLVSKGKGDWLYGKFEIMAKLPEGRGMWPAIWMLPTDRAYGGGFSSGEIDIMENLGFIPYMIAGTIQTQLYNFHLNTHKQQLIPILDCYTNFHVYSLEWEPTEIRIYADKVLYNTFKNEGTGFQAWPFDKRFHLILNIAVGGIFGGASGIDELIFPQSMEIDYVRVYQMDK